MSYMFHAKETSVKKSFSRSLEHCYTLIEGLSTNTSRRHADCKSMSCESDHPRLFKDRILRGDIRFQLVIVHFGWSSYIAL